MEVKTFEGTSMKSALRAVKETFGSDAVIIKTGERRDPNGIKVVEITAASATNNANASSSVQGLEEYLNLLNRMDEKLQDLSSSMVRREQIYALENVVEELRRAQLREQTSKVSNSRLIRQLSLAGVEESILTQIETLFVETPEDQQRQKLIKWIFRKIDLYNLAPGVHFFVGPTGSGKTTTVVKLASQIKKDVRLVSFDPTKVASGESLRFFSQLIRLPMTIVNSLGDFQRLIEKYPETKYWLVDVGGVSPKNQKNIEMIKAIQGIDLPINNHLVLSCTERSEQLERSVGNFGSLGINSIIFAKLDETWNYGQIINTVVKWKVPISYFSVGQNVPGDIEKATRERVIERVLGAE